MHVLFVEPFFSVMCEFKAQNPLRTNPRNQRVWASIPIEKGLRRLGLGSEVKHISIFLSKLGVKAYRLQPSRAVRYF